MSMNAVLDTQCPYGEMGIRYESTELLEVLSFAKLFVTIIYYLSQWEKKPMQGEKTY